MLLRPSARSDIMSPLHNKNLLRPPEAPQLLGQSPACGDMPLRCPLSSRFVNTDNRHHPPGVKKQCELSMLAGTKYSAHIDIIRVVPPTQLVQKLGAELRKGAAWVHIASLQTRIAGSRPIDHADPSSSHSIDLRRRAQASRGPAPRHRRIHHVGIQLHATPCPARLALLPAGSLAPEPIILRTNPCEKVITTAYTYRPDNLQEFSWGHTPHVRHTACVHSPLRPRRPEPMQ